MKTRDTSLWSFVLLCVAWAILMIALGFAAKANWWLFMFGWHFLP